MKIKISKEQGNITRAEARFGAYSAGYFDNIYKSLERDKKLPANRKFTHLDCLKALNILAKTLTPEKNCDGLYCATDLINQVKKLPDIISIEKGEVSSKDVLALFFIFRDYSRSKWLKGNQTSKDYVRFANLTPMVLYAFKDRHNIKYSQWNIKDPKLGVLLGYDLKDLQDIRLNPDDYPYLEYEDKESLAAHRKMAYTRKDKYNINYWPNKLSSKDYPTIANLPKVAVNMMLQGHVANINHRVPDVHILDPFEWDTIPKAYDNLEADFSYTWQLGDDEFAERLPL